jgi:hypothetical protein
MCKKSVWWAVLCVLAVTGAAMGELVGHWKLDEGSGTTIADSSGKGNDGTIVGNPTWIAGVTGKALEFHGLGAAGGGGDHINCGGDASLDVTSSISIALWIRPGADDPEGKGTETAPMAKADQNMAVSWSWQVRYGWGSTQPYMAFTFNTSPRAWAYVGRNLVRDEWCHIACSHDGATLTSYLNGEQAETTAMGAITSSNCAVLIGSDGWGCDWIGAIDDVRIYNHGLTPEELIEAMLGAGPEVAADPVPENEAIDVPRDVVLGWTAGEYAATHDIYLGTVFDDVNNASRANPMGLLVSQSHASETYDPDGLLAFGQTYYWRVDEVNAAPDYTIFKGEVWSFTTEPFAYPVENIIATSNAVSDAASGPEKTVDGSGLDAEGRHSARASDMWLGTPPAGETAYIQYEFDGILKLHEMWIWNYNVEFELVLGFGLKNVTVEYSTDGVDWAVLGDVEVARAAAKAGYAHNTTIDLQGVTARYVRLIINSGWGMLGQYGLSEVRFLHIPVQARQAQPADGATDVALDVVLGWRSGREASSHDVYLGTDSGVLALVSTVAQASFAPGALDFGTTYYWRIDEVNEAASPTLWAGALWSFTTQEYALIDGFESYTDDIEAGEAIFDTWLDGWVNDTGSTVGHLDAPFAEQTIVHGGDQSMPLTYDNSASPFYSEAERTFDGPQDWTVGGADSLNLYFQGSATNSPQALYVTLEDSAGRTATVVHADADAVLATEWQQWQIPLSGFAGVTLSRVQTMMIGVGSRTSPAADGTGIVYIDDVGFGRPRVE